MKKSIRSERRRIWIFSELYFPEEASTSHLMTQIAEGLAEAFEVEVITGPATQRFRASRAAAPPVHNGIRIHRTAATTLPKDSLVGRAINMITRSLAILIRGLQLCRRDDFILVVTNPPLLPFAAALIHLLKGTRFVLLVHDVYPEALVAAQLIKPGSLMDRLGRMLSRWLYRRALRIISLGRDMTGLIGAKLPRGDDRVRVIPNWAELETIAYQEPGRSQWRQDLNLGDQFVALYAGTIGRTHSIETLVAAAEALRGQPDIHLLVSGFGAKENWLRTEIQHRALVNLSLQAFTRPRCEQGETLAAGDVGVISFMPGMSGVSVPSRMYNFMAAGRPIIAVAEADSELARVVREEEIGWVVAPGDGPGLAQALLLARSDREALAAMGARARRVAAEKYNQQKAVDAYRALFSELAASSPVAWQGANSFQPA